MTSPRRKGRSDMGGPPGETARSIVQGYDSRSAMTTAQEDCYRLRTEWLRYKSQLYDALTGLPALPAVVEDVRRILEARGTVDVVYLDLGRSGGHETTLGWAAYDHAVRELSALLVSLRQTGEI